VPQKLTEHVPQVNWRNRRIVITIVGCGVPGRRSPRECRICTRRCWPPGIRMGCSPGVSI
jgi:hypothetical protein